MKYILLFLLLPILTACPCQDCGPSEPIEGNPWHVKMQVNAHAGDTASSADVNVSITNYSHRSHESLVWNEETEEWEGESEVASLKEGDAPFDEEVKLTINWSCMVAGEEKKGKTEVNIGKKTAEGKAKITGLPASPPLAVYPWEAIRTIKCEVKVDEGYEEDEDGEEDGDGEEDEDGENREGDTDNENSEDSTEHSNNHYSGEKTFFIKKKPPELKFEFVKLEYGYPDSFADIKVKLVRDGALVKAGDRSYDMIVEARIPWSCKDINSDAKHSGDASIIIGAGAGMEEARIIFPDLNQESIFDCIIEASVYIDGYLIGSSVDDIEFEISEN